MGGKAKKVVLNSQQQALAEWRRPDGSLGGARFGLAGAGSGKTQTLTETILFLIRNGVAPNRILVTTFTRKAADGMTRRVMASMGMKPPGSDNDKLMLSREQRAQLPFLGTFHSFCWSVMTEDLAEFHGKTVEQVKIPEWRKNAIIEEVLKEMGLDTQEDATLILSRISLAKNWLVFADEQENATRFYAGLLGSEEMGAQMAQIYAAYQAKVRGIRLVDFDDWLLIVYRLFKLHPEILAKYQARYPFVLSDEVQDQNFAQTTILDMIAALYGNIFLVGDVKQSIYAFRGAAPEQTVLAFKERYPDGQILPLEINYRSDGFIIEAANNLTSHMGIPGEYRGKLVASKPGQNRPIVVKYQDATDEANAVVEAIKELKQAGHKLSEIAILYRTNSQSSIPEQALIKAKIPYVVIGGTNFYERREVKDMLCYLEIAKNPTSHEAGEAIKRVVNFATDEFADEHRDRRTGKEIWTHFMGKEFIAGVVGRARGEGISVYEALQAYVNSTQGVYRTQKDGVKDFRNLIDTLRDMIRRGKNPDEILNYVYTVCYEHHLTHTVDQEAQEGPAGDTRKENCKQMIAEMSRFKDVDSALAYVNYLQVQAAKNRQESLDAVQLMTGHRSKGLEFDIVLNLGWNQGTLPHARAEVEEERRIAYVKLTRARKKAYIFTSGGSPSQFIGELELPEPQTSAEMDDRLIAILAGEDPQEYEDRQFAHRFGREMDFNPEIRTLDTVEDLDKEIEATIGAKVSEFTLDFSDADDSIEE